MIKHAEAVGARQHNGLRSMEAKTDDRGEPHHGLIVAGQGNS